VKIEAPNRGHNGLTAGVQFKDGVGHTDDERIADWFRNRGYTVDGQTRTDVAPPPGRLQTPDVDARDVTAQLVGSPLRDAAVDPRPQDYLPPVHAGEADPHGPTVIAPQVHASGEETPRPGPVSGNLSTQQAAEEAHATGRRDGEQAGTPVMPKRADKVDVWRDYARGLAKDSDEAARIEKATKAELIADYGQAPASTEVHAERDTDGEERDSTPAERDADAQERDTAAAGDDQATAAANSTGE
jgi:hypothetical protein